MSGEELCFLTLAQQAKLIRAREVSPVEVASSALRQIERFDGKVNAHITVMGDSARSAARQAEAEIAGGSYRGPLHGIPIALKDLFYTKGIRTTMGSKILRDFVPTEDAAVVARLVKAGGVITGKTNLHEFAFGATNINAHYGDVRNPWDPERISGGSSGGSAAAVSTSMCSAALGSDTGGSIRIPASLCGVTGLKPTYGRVSRHGAFPCAWSMDTVGPMAKTAEDVALVLTAIAGHDPKDPACSPQPVPDYAASLSERVSGLRLAVLTEYLTDPMETEVVSSFTASLEVMRGLGMKVEEVSMPCVDYAIGASTAILFAEGGACHEERMRSHAADYGEDVRSRIEQGFMISATDYLKAQRVRRLLIDQFRDLLRRYDALLCPTEPATAPRRDQELVYFDGLTEHRSATMVRHTRLFNLTSLPTASIPCGFASNGLPIGLQIAGAPFAEGTVLKIAHAYQQNSDWHLRRPPVLSLG